MSATKNTQFPTNDIADWGDKNQAGAYAPGTTFTINGQPANVDQLPPLSPGDVQPKGRKRKPAAAAPTVLGSMLDAGQPTVPSGGA